MTKKREKILYSLLNNPKFFNPFSKYFGDQGIVDEVVREETGSSGSVKILDLGCGTGNLSRLFPPMNYIGVDSDEKYINFARENYKREFHVMNASDLKFSGDAFDMVFSKDLFHHLKDDEFVKVLSEIKRVLKPSGKALIIEISYRMADDLLYKKILRRLDRGEHIREFSALERFVRSIFSVEKSYIKRGVWGDLAVFIVRK